MAEAVGFEDGERMLEGLRRARLEMINFRHDADTPGEVGQLARLCWVFGPEAAKHLGGTLESGEGYPPGIVSSDLRHLTATVAQCVQAARPVAEWLKGHVSAETEAMFAKGRDNAFDAALTRLAERGGFVRDDALTREAGVQPARAGIAHAVQRERELAR